MASIDVFGPFGQIIVILVKILPKWSFFQKQFADLKSAENFVPSDTVKTNFEIK